MEEVLKLPYYVEEAQLEKMLLDILEPPPGSPERTPLQMVLRMNVVCETQLHNRRLFPDPILHRLSVWIRSVWTNTDYELAEELCGLVMLAALPDARDLLRKGLESFDPRIRQVAREIRDSFKPEPDEVSLDEPPPRTEDSPGPSTVSFILGS